MKTAQPRTAGHLSQAERLARAGVDCAHGLDCPPLVPRPDGGKHPIRVACAEGPAPCAAEEASAGKAASSGAGGSAGRRNRSVPPAEAATSSTTSAKYPKERQRSPPGAACEQVYAAPAFPSSTAPGPSTAEPALHR